MKTVNEIPPRIIQTAKSHNLPTLARAAAVNLKLLHPDWEYLFFDDSAVRQFIAREFPQYQQIFDSFPHTIQRIDFFRYLAVYRYGGFYFDTDVFLAEPLSSLLKHSCVFTFEELTLNRFLRTHYGLDWEVGNYAFGSAPGHPFLRAVIENCVRAQKEPAWVAPMMADIPRVFRFEFHVLYTTGPGLITRTLAENPELAKSVTVLFPDDVCDDENWHRFGKYGIHTMDASWRTHGGFLWRKLALKWEMRRRRKLLAESRAAGPKRIHPVTRLA